MADSVEGIVSVLTGSPFSRDRSQGNLELLWRFPLRCLRALRDRIVAFASGLSFGFQSAISLALGALALIVRRFLIGVGPVAFGSGLQLRLDGAILFFNRHSFGTAGT